MPFSLPDWRVVVASAFLTDQQNFSPRKCYLASQAATTTDSQSFPSSKFPAIQNTNQPFLLRIRKKETNQIIGQCFSYSDWSETRNIPHKQNSRTCIGQFRQADSQSQNSIPSRFQMSAGGMRSVTKLSSSHVCS